MISSQEAVAPRRSHPARIFAVSGPPRVIERAVQPIQSCFRRARTSTKAVFQKSPGYSSTSHPRSSGGQAGWCVRDALEIRPRSPVGPSRMGLEGRAGTGACPDIERRIHDVHYVRSGGQGKPREHAHVLTTPAPPRPSARPRCQASGPPERPGLPHPVERDESRPYREVATVLEGLPIHWRPARGWELPV